MTKKALVVLSGGQDSTTCLLWARHNYGEVRAVSFDYGQKHRVELESAARIARMLGVEHTVLNTVGLLRGRSPLVDPTAKLETYRNADEMDAIIGDRVELTFVPLRNLLFLVLAANYALSWDCYDLITGVCAMDNANYPDCTEPFLNRTEQALCEALGMYRSDYKRSGKPAMNLVAPLLYKSKAETVQFATMYEGWEEALAESHTCYAGEVPPCGKCHACVLRAKGFADAGVVDPLVEKWARSCEPCGAPGCPEHGVPAKLSAPHDGTGALDSEGGTAD